jgi:hypothetical protein
MLRGAPDAKALVTEDERITNAGAGLLEPVGQVAVDADAGFEGTARLIPPGQAAVSIGHAVKDSGYRTGVGKPP